MTNEKKLSEQWLLTSKVYFRSTEHIFFSSRLAGTLWDAFHYWMTYNDHNIPFLTYFFALVLRLDPKTQRLRLRVFILNTNEFKEKCKTGSVRWGRAGAADGGSEPEARNAEGPRRTEGSPISESVHHSKNANQNCKTCIQDAHWETLVFTRGTKSMNHWLLLTETE